MASSALRRSLPRCGSLRGLLPSGPPSAATAAASSSFRRYFQSGEHESPAEFEARLFGKSRSDDKPLYGSTENPRGRNDMGYRMGVSSEAENENRLFGQAGPDAGTLYRKLDGMSSSSFGTMDGFDSSNDGMDERLNDAARKPFFEVTEEVLDDDYEFRPDVNYRQGSTYNVRDLDLTRPAATNNARRRQFETTTAEVLRKADFRNVRFLANFLTEAGIIIKRSQTKISAKAQRKVAREIKTARALGLMPFTTMGKKPFMFGRSAEEDLEEEEYGYSFVEEKEAGPEDDAVPDVENA